MPLASVAAFQRRTMLSRHPRIWLPLGEMMIGMGGGCVSGAALVGVKVAGGFGGGPSVTIGPWLRVGVGVTVGVGVASGDRQTVKAMGSSGSGEK